VSHFGRLDVLVNNAGILEMGTIETSTLEQYDRVFNTNVRSIYNLTQLAVPHLIKSKGNIVNVSSVNGIRSVIFFYKYGTGGEFPIKDPITDQRCAHLYYQQKLCAIDTFNEKLLGKNLKNGIAHILNCKHRLRIFFSYGLIENWYLIGNSP